MYVLFPVSVGLHMYAVFAVSGVSVISIGLPNVITALCLNLK